MEHLKRTADPARLARTGIRHFIAVLLPLVLLVPWRAFAAEGLPEFAFSLPSGAALSDSLKSAEACGLTNKILVMPQVLFRFSGTANAGNLYVEQAKAVASVPEDAAVYLHVKIAAGTPAGNEPEKSITDSVAGMLKQMPLSLPMVRGLIVEVEEPIAVPDLLAFALTDLAVAAKGSKTDLRVAFVLPAGFVQRHGDLVKRLALYADLLGVPYTPGWAEDAAWIASQALNKPLLLKLEPGQATPASYLAAGIAASGGSVDTLWAEPPDEAAMSGLCSTNTLAGRFITSQFVTSSPDALPFRIRVSGIEPAAQKSFTAAATGDIAILARVDGSQTGPNNVVLEGRAAGNFEIQWIDPLSGSRLAPDELKKTADGVTQVCNCTSEYALIHIHRVDSEEGRGYTAIEVKGTADLTVEEIIARWQQYRESQRQKLGNYLASCFMNLHFESTNIGSGFDISMRFKEFVNHAGLAEWEQTEFYVNGVKFSNKREFPLPQLEPEKVLTQPLELKLNEKYTYTLLGTEKVNDALCYVLGVEPKGEGETLFSGKVWIDGATFRQVKQYLRQRGEKSNVVSNIETQNFDLVSDGKGNQFNLVKSIVAQQLLNAAGRDFVLQKTYQFSDFVINGDSFDQAVAAAHNSDDPMFQDTDQGLRSLTKHGDQRVLEASAEKRVRSIVLGTMYQGTFGFPIPIAGYSLADFNYRNTGAQLSIFFAGPLLAADISKQYGKKFRLGLDLALSGLPGNNRVYSGTTELLGQTVWTWEEDTGLRATWQATTSFSLTASSYISYEYYHGTSDTDKTFVLPRNGVTLLPSAELKYAHRGYIFSAQATRGERLGWTQWGYAAQPGPFNNAFTRYNADFNKTYYIGKFTKAGWDFAYFGGDQLDRFSRYWPSFFSEPRIHGIPGGTDQFDAVAEGNVNYGFNIMDFIKCEVLYGYARGRDTEESRQFKLYDGLELNFGTAGPFGTYLQGTVSYALDGNIPRYNSRWGVLFMMFKPLR